MKNNGVARHIIMLCAPFLLYAVSVVLISLFVFTAFIEPSSIWGAVMSGGNKIESNDQGVDHNIDYVKPSPIVQEEKAYYNLEEFPIIKWGKKWATISVPYLGAKDIGVYEGDSLRMLNYGIVHYYFSKMPGQGGNCVLSFHVNRQKELYYLEDLPIGELIEINASYGKYVYKVTSKDVFASNDSTLITRDEGEMLTIYTCYPKQGPYRKKRIAITGLLVEELSDPTWR
ncbi:MAG: sortase [Clostridia bacterium]|nr:sortase [Clostridia bacterium]